MVLVVQEILLELLLLVQQLLMQVRPEDPVEVVDTQVVLQE